MACNGIVLDDMQAGFVGISAAVTVGYQVSCQFETLGRTATACLSATKCTRNSTRARRVLNC